MSLRLLPNTLTLLRAIAVGPIVMLLLAGQHATALWIAIAAGLSDLLDGYLARRFGWQTEWGGVLDPLADKLLIVCTTVTLAWLGQLPWWLVGLVILRDVVIVGGGLYYHWRVAPFLAEPTTLSKMNSFLLVMLVLVVMLRLAWPAAAGPWEDLLIAAVTLTLISSGMQYVVTYWRRTREARRGH